MWINTDRPCQPRAAAGGGAAPSASPLRRSRFAPDTLRASCALPGASTHSPQSTQHKPQVQADTASTVQRGKYHQACWPPRGGPTHNSGPAGQAATVHTHWAPPTKHTQQLGPTPCRTPRPNKHTSTCMRCMGHCLLHVTQLSGVAVTSLDAAPVHSMAVGPTRMRQCSTQGPEAARQGQDRPCLRSSRLPLLTTTKK
jgi:hypothetical protein